MDHDVLMEMERSLSGNKTMNKLTLSDGPGVTLPKQFCHHLLLGIRRNKSLSEVNLYFTQKSWYCPDDGRLVYVSFTYYVTQLDVVYSV